MKTVCVGLSRSLGPFMGLAPSPFFMVKHRYAKAIGTVIDAAKDAYMLFKGKPVEDIAGRRLAGVAIRRMKKRPKAMVKKGLMMAQINSRRTLLDPVIQEVERDDNKRIIRRMRVMFHDANKARQHLDVHIGRTSLIYKITGKPVENKIRYNHKGELTEEAKKALMNHLKTEISGNSRVAQNLDHTIANAKCSWLVGDPGISGYGSGLTRQLVSEGDVEFYHHKVRSSEHIYVPKLFGSQGTYLYQIYPGTDTGVPILIWGKLIPRDENFKDRLHLKLIQPEEFETKYKGKINESSNTRKYDGASCHFTSNGQGFKFFSPRFSRETNHRIEYTFKVPELAEVGHPAKPQGMGEMLFWKRTGLGRLSAGLMDWRGLEGPFWNYLSASEIGGILNNNNVRSRHVYPEIRIYRIDRWNKANTYDLEFFSNRLLQHALMYDLKGAWKVVARTRPVRNPATNSWEGFVGVPEGQSVNNGLKVKWWGNANDWEVIKNELSLSEKGNVQGVIWFRSQESGRKFKLGPGQIGSFDANMALLEANDKVVGAVAKVHGRQGHEGRAAKVVEWHLDKGAALPDYFR